MVMGKNEIKKKYFKKKKESILRWPGAGGGSRN